MTMLKRSFHFRTRCIDIVKCSCNGLSTQNNSGNFIVLHYNTTTNKESWNHCNLRFDIFQNSSYVNRQRRTFASIPDSKYGVVEIGPLSKYRRLINNEELWHDEEQYITVVKLQKLCEYLLAYEPQINTNKVDGESSAVYTRSSILSKLYGDNFDGKPSSKKDLIPTINDETDYYVGPKGVWLHGEVGTGKTMIMDMFYDTAPISKKRRYHFSQFSIAAYAKIFHWQKQQQKNSSEDPMKNLNSRKSTSSVTKAVAKEFMKDSWLFCIDEFQATDIATAAVLKEILHHMFCQGAVIVTTSNRIPTDIYKGGFQRHLYGPFIEMLQDRCEIFSLKGKKDYRKRIANESLNKECYYVTSDEEQVKAFIQRVSKLFYGKDLKRKQQLKLYGRTIEIPKSVDEIALFTFDRLCGSEDTKSIYGQADFLRICQTYPTIILQNVPVMDLLQKNEARRFINFIDAAYENKCKLILSAQDVPENLFVASDQLSKQAMTSELVMHQEMIGDLLNELKPTKEEDEEQKGNLQENNDLDETLNSKIKGDRRLKTKFIQRLAIFTAEDEKFAFKRAVSRIYEMMSEEWWETPHKPQSFQDKVEKTNERLNVPGGNQPSHLNQNKSTAASTNLKQGGQYNETSEREVALRPGYGEDFGAEASYEGYYHMYRRYNKEYKAKHKSFENFDPNEEGTIEQQGVEKWFSTRERRLPRFKEEHFWGMAEWGKRAGEWGQGVKAWIYRYFKQSN